MPDKRLFWVARNARIVADAADLFCTPNQVVIRKVVDCIDGRNHPKIICAFALFTAIQRSSRDPSSPRAGSSGGSSPNRLASPQIPPARLFCGQDKIPTRLKLFAGDGRWVTVASALLSIVTRSVSGAN